MKRRDVKKSLTTQKGYDTRGNKPDERGLFSQNSAIFRMCEIQRGAQSVLDEHGFLISIWKGSTGNPLHNKSNKSIWRPEECCV